MIPTVDEIISERGANYGSFPAESEMVAAMCKAVNLHGNPRLTEPQRHSLYMSFTKVARICNGNPSHLDSWIDISGYATLGARSIPGAPTPPCAIQPPKVSSEQPENFIQLTPNTKSSTRFGPLLEWAYTAVPYGWMITSVEVSKIKELADALTQSDRSTTILLREYHQTYDHTHKAATMAGVPNDRLNPGSGRKPSLVQLVDMIAERVPQT